MRKYGILTAWALLAAILLGGCSVQKEEGERREIEFTVAAWEKLPGQLAEAIEKNKKDEIRMTYTDGADMYLIRGYGEQKTGGYSVAVAECSEDETTVFFDTRLIGPQKEEEISKDPSYPLLVVKIEARDKEVMIQ